MLDPGKPRLGGLSRAGDERLRQLLVVGATAVIQHAKPGRQTASPWLLALLGRKPRKLAAVASANKTARIVGAMSGLQDFQIPMHPPRIEYRRQRKEASIGPAPRIFVIGTVPCDLGDNAVFGIRLWPTVRPQV